MLADANTLAYYEEKTCIDHDLLMSFISQCICIKEFVIKTFPVHQLANSPLAADQRSSLFV
jgi:hypothetical protein